MTNFPFSRKILMSKKDKQPSFSFSNEVYVGMFGRKILSKLFCLIEIGKQYKYIIEIPSTEERMQTVRAIFEPFIFKTAHESIR